MYKTILKKSFACQIKIYWKRNPSYLHVKTNSFVDLLLSFLFYDKLMPLSLFIWSKPLKQPSNVFKDYKIVSKPMMREGFYCLWFIFVGSSKDISFNHLKILLKTKEKELVMGIQRYIFKRMLREREKYVTVGIVFVQLKDSGCKMWDTLRLQPWTFPTHKLENEVHVIMPMDYLMDLGLRLFCYFPSM